MPQWRTWQRARPAPPQTTCPSCQARVLTRAPRGGDGTARIISSHAPGHMRRNRNQRLCDGAGTTVDAGTLRPW